jgi:hypothetical protein
VLNDVFGKYCADVKNVGTAQTFFQSTNLLNNLPSCSQFIMREDYHCSLGFMTIDALFLNVLTVNVQVFKTRRNHSSHNAKINLAVSVLAWGLLCWHWTPHRIAPWVYPCNHKYLFGSIRLNYRLLVDPP